MPLLILPFLTPYVPSVRMSPLCIFANTDTVRSLNNFDTFWPFLAEVKYFFNLFILSGRAGEESTKSFLLPAITISAF